MGKYSRQVALSDRYIYIYIAIYLFMAILAVALFNLQIIKGKDYRQQSENRLLREKTVVAPRGEIYDKNGNLLVSNQMGFNLLLYKTKITNDELNDSLLKISKILINNGDNYVDTLPIEVLDDNSVIFTFTGEDSIAQEEKWKEKYKYDKELTAENILTKLKEKYKIKYESLQELRIIAGQRFDITRCGYTAYNPYQIAQNICRESVNQIEEQNANFPGINIITVPIRKYIKGSLAAHILGYTGQISSEELEIYSSYSRNDMIGKTGIESVFEKYLRGTNGTKKIEMDSNGRINEEYEVNESIKGSDIVLTIDANLQEIAENSLKNTIEKIATGGFATKYEDANAGAVVVMDVNTGKMLAMASYPTYDPSLFNGGISKSDWNYLSSNVARPLYNRVIQAAYAPGSTFKMISAVAGLESGVIERDEKILDVGKYDKGHKPTCWYYSKYGLTHGYVNVTEAIKTSCNCFFYETGYRMGIDNLSKYASYFGLGKKTGIGLLGEINGVLASREYAESKGNQWYVADTLSASIGQSYNSFTPLQITKYIAMLTNGGKEITPTIIEDILTNDGLSYSKVEIEKYVNEKIGFVETQSDIDIDNKNLKAVLQGMKDVTDEIGGTAYGLFKQIPVAVGGKTGTAQAGAGSDNGVFVAFAPFDKPEIAITVVVEHGGHGSYAGEVARDILIEYFGVNAEKIYENKEVRNLGNTIE